MLENDGYLEGPVLKIDGQLTLMIPLHVGGSDLIDCCRGISDVTGDFLKIVIPQWLAGGCCASMKETSFASPTPDGKLHIVPPNPRTMH
jgi:hypothetical protein